MRRFGRLEETVPELALLPGVERKIVLRWWRRRTVPLGEAVRDWRRWAIGVALVPLVGALEAAVRFIISQLPASGFEAVALRLVTVAGYMSLLVAAGWVILHTVKYPYLREEIDRWLEIKGQLTRESNAQGI